jgi:GH24 family phage-related lysozyme (muramidase)
LCGPRFHPFEKQADRYDRSGSKPTTPTFSTKRTAQTATIVAVEPQLEHGAAFPDCDKLILRMDTSPILARLERFEGRIPYMYRCTGGEVTVGIGHAILTAADAAALTWNVDGRAATANEIAAGYARIAAEPAGRVASHYKPLSRCRMTDAAIDALAVGDVARFSALLDMAFNLGVAGLQEFKKLIAACDAGHWEAAAHECHRRGIAEFHNQEIAALFRAALRKGPDAIPATRKTTRRSSL